MQELSKRKFKYKNAVRLNSKSIKRKSKISPRASSNYNGIQKQNSASCSNKIKQTTKNPKHYHLLYCLERQASELECKSRPVLGKKRPRVAFQSQAAKRQTENTKQGASSVQPRKSKKIFFLSAADSVTTAKTQIVF